MSISAVLIAQGMAAYVPGLKRAGISLGPVPLPPRDGVCGDYKGRCGSPQGLHCGQRLLCDSRPHQLLGLDEWVSVCDGHSAGCPLWPGLGPCSQVTVDAGRCFLLVPPGGQTLSLPASPRFPKLIHGHELDPPPAFPGSTVLNTRWAQAVGPAVTCSLSGD